MEVIETTSNMKFDVIYVDGTRRHVEEGVLYEVENEKIIFHNGTGRAVVLFAVAEDILGAIDYIGLTKLFVRYISEDPADARTLEVLAKIESILNLASNETQAVFRLGQKDMQASICDMLRDMANGAAAPVRTGLTLAADLVESMEVPV